VRKDELINYFMMTGKVRISVDSLFDPDIKPFLYKNKHYDEKGLISELINKEQEIRIWKYEVIDGDFSKNAREVLTKAAETGESFKLHEIFDAPKLYAAYPRLRNLKVFYDYSETDSLGAYFEDDEIIGLYGPQIKSETVIHEIQHYIQSTEGFARGSNPDRSALELDKQIEHFQILLKI